ncbi:hypothetical protein SASPL_145220 [Salvia splendens]|uniref:Uncharacterized protein n=1 Tax=Salvia splendens TaxID=180675 RepID=A0A8X8Z7H0_SALSN|nr:hypothetical protein SASPL_145220 [Salvia splendens]
MGNPVRRAVVSSGWHLGRTNETMRLIITTFVNLSSNIFPSVDLTYIEDKYSGLSTQALLNVWSALKGMRGISRKYNNTKVSSFMKFAVNHSLALIAYPDHRGLASIWVPTNPRGAERLPPGILVAESDLYTRRLWGVPGEDLIVKPRYLMTFTVGYDQKDNINAAVKKVNRKPSRFLSAKQVFYVNPDNAVQLTENFQVLLFHYDGRPSEWDEFEWSKRAIHVSVRKQTKWWYAKRFLHPNIVAPYDYIFIWDEDLGVENFNPEEYIKLVRKHGLDISQPGLSPDSGMTWEMTRRREDTEVHKDAEERPGWCTDPHQPPCAAFVEIMAPVFSRNAWRCVWHMIQNDLVHGWGLDFALRKCVEPAHEKIGVVDAQWIVHQTVPSLGNQGQEEEGKAPWEGVRERCKNEWTMFQDRWIEAEKVYFEAMGIDPPNSTIRY